MLDVRGFCGYTFDTGEVGSQDAVITPPYDVISPAERGKLAAGSPYSMVHVLMPKKRGGLAPYEAARETIESWIAQGALRRDGTPSLYLLRQHFTDLEGAVQVRRGFFATARLPEDHEHFVLGHESTFRKPLEDRFRLTQATRANLGAIFVLYSDPDHGLAPLLGHMDRHRPDATAQTIDGVKQEFWRVPDDGAVTQFFRGKTLYIADGHHRFQTACAYRDEMRGQDPADELQPYDFVLMGFVAFEDRGLKIYPPHRLLAKPEGFNTAAFLRALEQWFVVTPVDADLATRIDDGAGDCVMGVAVHGAGDYLLTLRDIDRVALLGDDRGPAWRDLDVAVLYRGIIEGILGAPPNTRFSYEKDVNEAVAAAHSGDAGLAFLLRGMRAEQIRACAEAHEPMPQKSTYFFPKMPSGVVIHRLV